MLPDRLLIEVHKWSRVLVVIGMVMIGVAITIAAALGLGLLTPSHWRETAQHLLVMGGGCVLAGGLGLNGSRWGRGV